MRNPLSLRQEIGPTTPLVLVAVVVLVTGVGALGPDSWERVAIECLIAIVTVVGLYLFVGNTGILSFGHPTFLAVGAYTSTLLTLPTERKTFTLPDLPGPIADLQLPWALALLVGMLVAGLVGLAFSYPLARLDGIAAAIGTLALLEVGHGIIVNWKSVTNGQSAIVGISQMTTLWVGAVAAGLAIAAAWWLQISRLGRRSRATREDPRAARAIGIDLYAHRRWCFVASAVVTAAGGSLYVHFVGVASADAFFLAAAFASIAMLVLGGANSLSGAVIGALVFVVLRQMLRVVEGGIALGPIRISNLQGFPAIGAAIAVLVVLAFRPDGLTAGRELRIRTRADTEPVGPASHEISSPLGVEKSLPRFTHISPTTGAQTGVPDLTGRTRT